MLWGCYNASRTSIIAPSTGIATEKRNFQKYCRLAQKRGGVFVDFDGWGESGEVWRKMCKICTMAGRKRHSPLLCYIFKNITFLARRRKNLSRSRPPSMWKKRITSHSPYFTTLMRWSPNKCSACGSSIPHLQNYRTRTPNKTATKCPLKQPRYKAL